MSTGEFIIAAELAIIILMLYQAGKQAQQAYASASQAVSTAEANPLLRILAGNP